MDADRQIKGVEDIGNMEEKLKEMGRELSGLRDREAIMRNQLETKNAWLSVIDIFGHCNPKHKMSINQGLLSP